MRRNRWTSPIDHIPYDGMAYRRHKQQQQKTNTFYDSNSSDTDYYSETEDRKKTCIKSTR